MVIFCIGEAYDELSVHRKRLCGQSILFGNAFAVPSDEFLPFLQRTLGVDTTINQYTGAIVLLSEVYRVQVMTVLVEYLYSGALPNPLPFAQFHALYRLADAFQMPVLQNKLLDLAQEKHIVNGTCFDAKEIAAIYNHREIGQGKLWKHCCYLIIGRVAGGIADAAWTEAFKRQCKTHAGMARDIFVMQMEEGELIRKYQAVREDSVVRESVFCQFHIHDVGHKCGEEHVKKTAKKSKKSRKAKKAEKAEKDKKERGSRAGGSVIEANRLARELSEGVKIKRER